VDARSTDARVPDAETVDARIDAPVGNPVTTLGACLGTSAALTLSGQMPYVSVPVGSYTGEFVLDFASTFSSIDLSAFASPGPSTSGCNASLLGEDCTVAGFAFFSSPASVVLTTEDFSGVTGTVRQAGIIGTDFLSEKIFTLDYGDLHAFAAASAAFCSDAAMGAAGLVPLTTAGYYENNLSLLKPATDVDSQASAGSNVPNVPTVPVKIGGVAAIAQLDTGFDDDVTPFSVNINEAFFTAITTASGSALVRDSSLDTMLTTCVEGVDEPVVGYRLGASATFDFVQVNGTAARSYGSSRGVAVFEKQTPAAAQSCGGIGTWSVPAAQVAASYFNDMRLLAFDPFTARVWVLTTP
jgi:hypothetical protein